MKRAMTHQECVEHQALLRANIADAEAVGDKERAQYLRDAFAPMLALDLTEPEPLITLGEMLAWNKQGGQIE